MFRVFRQKFGIKKNVPFSHMRLTIIVSFIATLLCLPWAYMIDNPSGLILMDLPYVYFFNILLFPLFVLLLLFWYARKADERDRHEE